VSTPGTMAPALPATVAFYVFPIALPFLAPVPFALMGRSWGHRHPLRQLHPTVGLRGAAGPEMGPRPDRNH
jgi:hypothetical protein